MKQKRIINALVGYTETLEAQVSALTAEIKNHQTQKLNELIASNARYLETIRRYETTFKAISSFVPFEALDELVDKIAALSLNHELSDPEVPTASEIANINEDFINKCAEHVHELPLQKALQACTPVCEVTTLPTTIPVPPIEPQARGFLYHKDWTVYEEEATT